MSGLSWTRIKLLLGADLRTLLRDRVGLVGILLLLLVVGASGPIGTRLAERLHPERAGEPGVASAWDCKPGELGPVAVAGEMPAWFVWPEPPVAAEEAEHLIRPGQPGDDLTPPEIEVVELVDSTHQIAVDDCVWQLVQDERRERLDALGITEDPRDLERVRTLPPSPPRSSNDMPPLAPLALIGGLTILMVSAFVDLGPLARQTGWLESFLALPGNRRDLVYAWWLVGVLTMLAGAAAILAGSVLGTFATGIDGGTVPYLLLLPLVAVLSAVGVRAFVDVADMRTSMVRGIPVMFSMLLLGGLAAAMEAKTTALGGLVPVGGLLLAVAGRTDGIALAVTTSLAASFLLLHSAGRALERIVVRAAATGQTASRRAGGDFGPEVLLLCFVALAGIGAWAPPELALEGAPARNALSLVLFLALPALLVNVPLHLDRSPLLSLSAPRRRVWAVLPFLVAATLALAGELWRITLHFLPDPTYLEAYAGILAEFDGIWGLLVISLVPGICEELLFRGAVLGLLRRSYPLWTAIVLQAAAFAVLHVLAVRLPYTFALGLIFGLLVARTGSLWPAIAAHIAHNLLAVLLPPGARDLPPAATWTIVGVGLAITWWGTRGAGKADDNASPG